jgi:hypothetical protein
MLEPYTTDSSNRGGVLFDSKRLSKFMLEVDPQGINLHLHTVGDRATRDALDAVELARGELGRPLSIQVTLCHLETVDPADIPRFAKLGVHANFTPHWFDGMQFGAAAEINLGPERIRRQQLAGSFVRAGANVTLSSDVTATSESHRADPFIGIEMSVTRRDYAGSNVVRSEQDDERLSLDQALRAYTLGGARQLGIESEIGTIETGKRADLVILGANPFEIAPEVLNDMPVRAVLLDGKVVSGSLPELGQLSSAQK